MSAETEKQALRGRCKAAARALGPAYREIASRSIERQALALSAYRQARVVFVYVSTPEEPDTAGIIRDALKEGKRVCVPRCREKPCMDAVEIAGLGELSPGAFGIPEPPVDAPAVDPRAIDFAVVPCVSASKTGRRLGHGGGYYDAFLPGTRCEKVCLCFGALLREDIPMGERDTWMDRVITEETENE